MRLAKWDRHEIIAQYEALRREATSFASEITPAGRGLTLFIMRGMYGWLETLTALAPPIPSTERHGLNARCAEHTLGAAVRAQLTAVLVGMVLACTQTEEAGGEQRG